MVAVAIGLFLSHFEWGVDALLLSQHPFDSVIVQFPSSVMIHVQSLGYWILKYARNFSVELIILS